MGPNSRRESNYTEDVTDVFIGLNGVYDNGFDWQAGISTTEYNSLYESSPLTTAVYDWITGADRGDTTDISGFYKWRGDLYYNAGLPLDLQLIYHMLMLIILIWILQQLKTILVV